MSNAEVTITINADGTSEISVSCVKGTSCADLTKDIERALGTVKADKKTPEYFEKETARVKNTH
jgi:hypothetical protein